MRHGIIKAHKRMRNAPRYRETSLGRGRGTLTLSYGHRRFVPIISADADAAEQLIYSIKSELNRNDLLMEDFPEICHPIRCLENQASRTRGQTIDGKYTLMIWSADKIVFP